MLRLVGDVQPFRHGLTSLPRLPQPDPYHLDGSGLDAAAPQRSPLNAARSSGAAEGRTAGVLP
jgi:hypothetical protein